MLLAKHHNDPGHPFALYGTATKSPRVFCTEQLEDFLGAAKREAAQKLGVMLAGKQGFGWGCG